MVSYQNTSELYCGISDMNNFIDQNVYFDQNSANYQIPPNITAPENVDSQQVYPILSPDFNAYTSAQGEHLTTYDPSAQYYGIQSVPQYPVQYVPLTPEPVAYPIFNVQEQTTHNSNFMAKRHRAQISIVPTSRGHFKAVVKRKRKRTIFTTEQVEALENIFQKQQYITREDRQDIVQILQINDKAVKIWFQNRRLKNKRLSEETLEEQANNSFVPLPEERNSPDIARLDFVESQINKKTDENGFVTLDDGVMENLANVIDNYLTGTSLDGLSEESQGSDDSPIYEPISPASNPDTNEEENSHWKPTEPNESFQRLFDLQSMLSL